MQKKYSFDKETLHKIGRGALIGISGGAAIGLMEYVGRIEISEPMLAAFIAWLVPTAINAIRVHERSMIRDFLNKIYLFLVKKNVEKRGIGHVVSAKGKAKVTLQVNRLNGTKETITLQ